MVFHHRLDIADLFEIQGRGVIVLTKQTYEAFPDDLVLRVGNAIEFHLANRKILTSRIAGIEIASPWKPSLRFAFLVSDLKKSDLEIGAEIWVDESSLKRSGGAS